MPRKTTTVYDDSIAEGVHVGFRKVSDHPAAQKAWRAINELPDDEWRAIVSFALHGAAVQPS